jgi:hypothetical protein
MATDTPIGLIHRADSGMPSYLQAMTFATCSDISAFRLVRITMRIMAGGTSEAFPALLEALCISKRHNLARDQQLVRHGSDRLTEAGMAPTTEFQAFLHGKLDARLRIAVRDGRQVGAARSMARFTTHASFYRSTFGGKTVARQTFSFEL